MLEIKENLKNMITGLRRRLEIFIDDIRFIFRR